MILVGQMIYGYCNGYFGRDSYGPKRIEAIGAYWIVVREDDGRVNFTAFGSESEMSEYIAKWSVKPKDEE
jgi:hypothetical protein